MAPDAGSLIIKASLPAEAGALFKKALDGAADEAFRERRAAVNGAAAGDRVSAETSVGSDHPAPGEWHPLSMRRADALARIAESFLAHGAEALASGERHHVVVHVDAETLREGGDGRCEHEHGPPLPVETARRLGVVLCRFHHRLVHEGGVEVQVLDDGALRFVVKGRAFDSAVPARPDDGHRRPCQDVTRGHWSALVANLASRVGGAFAICRV